MNRITPILFSLCTFFMGIDLIAQKTHRVLFLGNSYTGTNNLPQMIKNVALSVGDTLVFDANTPGGYKLQDHRGDALSQSKIRANGWDYVVLQEQSRRPILNTSQFFNGGRRLNDSIARYNPCAVTMLYMTWGRKNGDASYCPTFPEMCTYEGMDSTLRNKYLDLASTIYTEVSPVSVVWNYLRQNHPGIELYHPDGSHPSIAGTYAAACCFYAAIFKKDPTLISFNSGLSITDATNIKNAAKVQVFNNLNMWDYKQPPTSNFGYQIGSGTNEMSFYAIGTTAETYLWDFGDNTTSSLRNPTHSYLSNGTYTVKLTTTNCDLQGLHTSVTDTVIQFCSHSPTVTISNSWLCQEDTLWTQAADAYQWFNLGQPIPETNQYLANYDQYAGSQFFVATTVNGCTELSPIFSANPQWSGYYFDASAFGGDPCLGDSVSFVVLHSSGSLSGAETIEWYRNGLLLPLFTNKDTLWITSGGTYESKLVNPNGNCPLDTIKSTVVFDCGVTADIEQINQDKSPFYRLFPNPTSETITIEFANEVVSEQLQIYNTMGYLVKEVRGLTTTTFNVRDLPRGMYFVRLKNRKQAALKFIKE